MIHRKYLWRSIVLMVSLCDVLLVLSSTSTSVYAQNVLQNGDFEGGGRTGEALNNLRVNQHGYLPGAPKFAILSNDSAASLSWELRDNREAVVTTGFTRVYGDDAASGEYVHQIDFSSFVTPGAGYTLKVGDDVSFPFDIRLDLYEVMKYDALAYLYHNRSGLVIEMPYAGEEQWARPAGHVPGAMSDDTVVTCFNQKDTEGTTWTGCSYTLDAAGGWYDAGDHGKYVVNGGISVWTMLNQYERAIHISDADATVFADGTMNIPEKNNGVPDILDEARWEVEFLLSMQVPPGGTVEGELLEGMVHHKIHDESWTGLGLAPHEDPRARYVYPPSTAATLNMAAVAAQAARIWETIDPAFAAKCLVAAETAWDAAVAHPDKYARGNFTGGGPYDDTYVGDEFYWAAVELYITTGSSDYKAFLLASPHFKDVPAREPWGDMGAMTWQATQALGTISLALVPNSLEAAQIEEARKNLIQTADTFLQTLDQEGYRLPFTVNADDMYPWGSNSFVLNNALILALAYDFSGETRYLNGVRESLDYILGKNPMDKSYVTGYGERPLLHPHHRFWAGQKHAGYPLAPPGAVSGGPNSSLQDPFAAPRLAGCSPQKCFIDDLDSWSTNEITINWNTPFAWVLSFLDETQNITDAGQQHSFLLWTR